MLTDHLPEWLSTFVGETADELQVPHDAVALLALGAVSAAINGGASTMPVPGWKEPATLYTLALLASGEGKSPVYTRLLDPVTKAFTEVTGVTQAADAKYQAIRNRVNKKYVKRVESKAMSEVAKGNMTIEEAVAEVAAAERAMSLSASTAVPQVVLTDATPAALIDALQDNNGRVVIASPEAEGLLNFRGGSKEALLKGYDGETLTQARRGTGQVTIVRPVLTMMLAMQPTVLNSLGADMVNRGVMPRFLISYPESLIGQRSSRPRLTSPEAQEAYEAEMLRIVKGYSDKEPKSITWNSDAVREIGTWRDEIEPLMAPDGMLGSIAAWASKVRGGHFLRLAAIIAIMNGRDTVALDDAGKAKAILRALMIDAKRAFGEMGASFADDDLVHLMAIAQRVGPDFSKRDVMRKSNRFMAHPERCGAALDLAVEQGLIEVKGRGFTLPA
jgi:replicative DNA helicase